MLPAAGPRHKPKLTHNLLRPRPPSKSGSAKMKVEGEVAMAHARNVHHQTPMWLQMWHVFALTATGIGMLLLLVILAALAIYG